AAHEIGVEAVLERGVDLGRRRVAIDQLEQRVGAAARGVRSEIQRSIELGEPAELPGAGQTIACEIDGDDIATGIESVQYVTSERGVERGEVQEVRGRMERVELEEIEQRAAARVQHLGPGRAALGETEQDVGGVCRAVGIEVEVMVEDGKAAELAREARRG